MIVLGIILSAFGLGFLCWVRFELAVYAHPSIGVASRAGLAVSRSGSSSGSSQPP